MNIKGRFGSEDFTHSTSFGMPLQSKLMLIVLPKLVVSAVQPSAFAGLAAAKERRPLELAVEIIDSQRDVAASHCTDVAIQTIARMQPQLRGERA